MSSDPLDGDQEYWKHEIQFRGGLKESGFGAYSLVRVKDSDGAVQCAFREEGSLPTEELRDRAIHRARGAVQLGRLHELDGRTFIYDPSHLLANRSEQYLRTIILSSLKRAFRSNPLQRGMTVFDAIGVALVEDINHNEVVYVQERLQIEGLVKTYLSGNEIGNWFLMPTEEGLREADRLEFPLTAPWNLIEEALVKVDSFLTKQRVQLLESLRRQAVRVAESSTLSDHEVGEIAQACEQVMWDFLDLDVLWNGRAVDRPARDRTRERVRVLLESVPSETERETIEGLLNYVLGWFGPLQQFVHKHRHLPGESGRGDARRIVTYTYLFLADVIDVLDVGGK